MRENFLHYIWKYKKFDVLHLKTTQNEAITLVSVGTHNHNSGPDFFNAQLKIGEQLWAGNIEIHIKSSDWFAHGHEMDTAYDNIILHVVYEHDTEVYRNDKSSIPTLELKKHIDIKLLQKYHELFSNKLKWINCENDFAQTDDFILSHWLERLYFERLERKSQLILDLLQSSNNNWEAALFIMLAKNFGLKVNADAFLSLANSVDFSIVQKSQSNVHLLEALFFGQAGLLDEEVKDPYFLNLKKDYALLKQKYRLTNDCVIPLQFFRLRPLNFPTIRLSQLANLYFNQRNLFSNILKSETLEDLYTLFSLSTTPYWETHYTFKKESKFRKKTTTKSFIDLLIINAIIPVKFTFDKQMLSSTKDHLLDLINTIKPEKNIIVDGFDKLKNVSRSALESQALVQLKTEYCNKHQCLNCAIGNSLLNK